MDFLCKSEPILQNIIVPHLLADLVENPSSSNSESKKRNIAMACLNRLNHIVG